MIFEGARQEWVEDLDRRERLAAGLEHLDRFAVSGAVTTPPDRPWPRWIAYPIIAALSLALWAALVYAALVMGGVE